MPQSKTMSLPGRFMLVVAGAAVLGLMAAMTFRTIEIYGGKTLASTEQDAEQEQVTELRKPLPAGPRRFQ